MKSSSFKLITLSSGERQQRQPIATLPIPDPKVPVCVIIKYSDLPTATTTSATHVGARAAHPHPEASSVDNASVKASGSDTTSSTATASYGTVSPTPLAILDFDGTDDEVVVSYGPSDSWKSKAFKVKKAGNSQAAVKTPPHGASSEITVKLPPNGPRKVAIRLSGKTTSLPLSINEQTKPREGESTNRGWKVNDDARCDFNDEVKEDPQEENQVKLIIMFGQEEMKKDKQEMRHSFMLAVHHPHPHPPPQSLSLSAESQEIEELSASGVPFMALDKSLTFTDAEALGIPTFGALGPVTVTIKHSRMSAATQPLATARHAAVSGTLVPGTRATKKALHIVYSPIHTVRCDLEAQNARYMKHMPRDAAEKEVLFGGNCRYSPLDDNGADLHVAVTLPRNATVYAEGFTDITWGGDDHPLWSDSRRDGEEISRRTAPDASDGESGTGNYVMHPIAHEVEENHMPAQNVPVNIHRIELNVFEVPWESSVPGTKYQEATSTNRA
ncbi:hypothetical protein DFH06DRAFT_1476216 [Mycena polygramma]|nr:hypothetical protein DFH06DRAFT_1476216 [Mycena polygramma]